AAEYLHSFGFTDIEVFVPRIRLPKEVEPEKDKKLHEVIDKTLGKQETRVFERPKWMTPKEIGFPLCPTSWLPDHCAVVVPGEKAYVGELTHVSAKFIAAIVHNPSRGMAIARSFVS
ncbi:MAG: hypothetical protein WC824_08135, partial [Bacteroidota bacterium]